MKHQEYYGGYKDPWNDINHTQEFLCRQN